MNQKSSILGRIIKSIKKNGGKDFLRIARLRIKTGLQIMVGKSPVFADQLGLPWSDKIVAEKQNAFYTGETTKYSAEISIQQSETMFWQIWHRFKEKKFESLCIINSAVPFNATYNQRPMNLAKHMAGKGYLVIFVCWQWSPDERIENEYTEVYPNLYQIPMYQFLSSQIQFADIINNSYGWKSKKFFITLPSRHFIPLVYELRKLEFAMIYDILDEWEEFHHHGQAPWFQTKTEEEYILNADKIFVVSPALKSKFLSLRADIEINGNGYSPGMLLSSSKFITETYIPRAHENIKIGYFGHLTEAWFDWDFVFQLAELFPKVTIEIIGYGCSDETLHKVNKFRNIKYLGKKNHENLKYYAATWKVGLIPFRKTILSEAVDPIKIYEYLFFGLPTLVTGIPHLNSYPFTEVVATIDDAFNKLPMLINTQKNMSTDKILEKFLKNATWENRFNALLNSTDKSITYNYFMN